MEDWKDLEAGSAPGDPQDSATRWSMIRDMRGNGPEQSAAWEGFMERYRPLVEGILRRRMGRERAEECKEEFWGYLFLGKTIHDADREKGSFRRYLSVTVTNFGRTQVRTRRKAPLPLEEDHGEGPSHEQPFEHEEVGAFARRDFAEALQSLPPRAVTLLRKRFGIDEAEVPPSQLRAELSLTPEAFDTAVHRARKKLSKRFVTIVRDRVYSDEDLAEELRLAIAELLKDYPPGLFRNWLKGSV